MTAGLLNQKVTETVIEEIIMSQMAIVSLILSSMSE